MTSLSAPPLPTTPVVLHPACIILLSVVFSRLLKLIPNEAVLSVLSPVYARVAQRSLVSRQRALKRELFETRTELGKTSSQDQFAKWAKLRRRVDKTVQELEGVNAALSSSRSSLSLLVRALSFTLSTLLPFGITTYFRKTPIFWLPPSPAARTQDWASAWKGSAGPAGDWLGPLGWALSLPSAPRGSVSATVWSQVCGRVLALVLALVADGWASVLALRRGDGEGSADSHAVRTAWYALGLASCGFAFSQFDYLEHVSGQDLSAQYGGHYQFLTNLGLVATSITLALALARTLLPSLPLLARAKETATVVTMPVEALISILYWTVLAIDPRLLIPERRTPDPANPGQFVMEVVRLPLVTDLCMHAFPAVFLLVDHLLLSPPSPSHSPSQSRALALLTTFTSTIAYCLWAELCAYHNGSYAYPLLDVLGPVWRGVLYVGCAGTMVGVLCGVESVKARVVAKGKRKRGGVGEKGKGKVEAEKKTQ